MIYNQFTIQTKKILVAFLLTGIFFSINGFAQEIPSDEATINAGKALFENNCTQCHAVSDEVVVGPGLKNVHSRRKLAWIQKWVRNSTLLINSGDKEAIEVFNKFNKVQMQSFAFSDPEITSIVAYIKSESEKAPAAAAATAPAAGADTAVATQAPQDTTTLNYILLLFVVILILILVILTLVISILTKYLGQKEGELTEIEKGVINTKIDFAAVYTSKPFKSAIVLIFVLVAGKACIDGMVGIGINQGYAPTQPITFSHKLHAGEYKINCAYCHTGVYKTKSANIPSANICMNCHNSIRQESPEIQKIYKAISTGRPVEWVRVHNLPDLAYFNHSQHVKVGGIECQQCHGPIETMEVVQQYSPLTMGWCINCHRETAVNGKGNAYYDNLMAVHNKNSKEPMKVKDIGGLECSKCHY
ncbi:MAG: cytochrome c3 family protein [Bacteroidota bacterium]|nr:cytochrome c3 family protein [Bacteroidota bacterium]